MRGAEAVTGLAIAGLWLLLLAVLASSASWPVEHDTPILMYEAFLVDHFGLLPYRDFFDMNFPGAILAYLVVGKLFGYSEPALRLADAVSLVGIAALTALVLRGFGLRVAAFAIAAFSLRYLGFGPRMTLQREFLLLVPMLAATACTVSLRGAPPRHRAALAGLCLGLGATLKPQIAIGLPVLLVSLARERGPSEARRGDGPRIAAWGAAGLLVPLALMTAALAAAGLLDEFAELVFGYLPLYASLTGEHVVVAGWPRAAYLVRHTLGLGGELPLCLAAVVGAWSCATHRAAGPETRRHLALFAGLAMSYGLYPALSGQFWPYHWLPFLYWLSLLASLSFFGGTHAGPARGLVAPLVSLLALLHGLGLSQGLHPLFAPAGRPATQGRPAAIAEFLTARLEPGDTVQPMDWAGTGVVHGMLLARAELATPFLYHFHFYHHVSSDVTRGLRRRFLREFAEAAPRFVIEGRVRRPFVGGPDTTRHFPAAEKLLRERYRPVVSNRDFTIWERSQTPVRRPPEGRRGAPRSDGS